MGLDLLIINLVYCLEKNVFHYYLIIQCILLLHYFCIIYYIINFLFQ